MSQTKTLVTTLKKMIKAHGLNYRDIASELDLSEASVKRLFAQRNFSIQRLEQVCHLLGIEIADLIRQMEADQLTLSELTDTQEHELVADLKLLLVAFLIINGWQFNDIISNYNLSETETIRCLAKLDRIKMIDLLPNNRIKLRVLPNFSWRRNGPIQQFFTENLKQDFLHSRFNDKQDFMQFPSGMLTQSSVAQLQQRMQQITQEFHQLKQQDMNRPADEREVYSLFLAFRPWRPKVFDLLRK